MKLIFIGQVKEILESSSVETNTIAPYHHRSNGLAEVNVKIFTNQIRKLFESEQDRENWHQFTPFIQMYMNNWFFLKILFIYNFICSSKNLFNTSNFNILKVFFKTESNKSLSLCSKFSIILFLI